jgi:hypothetical protein
MYGKYSALPTARASCDSAVYRARIGEIEARLMLAQIDASVVAKVVRSSMENKDTSRRK